MSEFRYRPATAEDIPFLVDTIIEAEKSGTSILTYTTIFGLEESEAKVYIAKMLEEEVDGCELSVSGFILAEIENNIVGAVGAWIEGSEGISSTALKGNLLQYVLPNQCLVKASSLNKIVSDLHIDYIDNTIQIGLVYVAPAARGKGLVSALIDRKIIELRQSSPEIKIAYVQVFGNNIPAIKAYEKAGFKIIHTKEASQKETINYMPHTSKILMQKNI